MATVQQFELLKKSAITDIQADLEAAVEADRIAAQAAASTATTKANESAASSVKASQWAENNEDVAVETGKFSAKHYSLKAAAQNAQMQAVYPTAAYRSRVLTDSGNIQDLNKLTELYIKNLKLLDSTVFLWSGVAGMKTRQTTASSPMFASKLYNMANKVQQFGTNLVTNGTFTGADGSTPAGWTGLNATLTVDTNRLKITNNNAGFTGSAYQVINTVANKTYHIAVSHQDGNASLSAIKVESVLGTNDIINQLVSSATLASKLYSFVAKTSTTIIRLAVNTTVLNDYNFWDNISVQQMDWIEGTNDAIQTTEANQPYVGGVIAPNEVRKLKGYIGSSDYVDFTPVVFASNSPWSVSFIAKNNGSKGNSSAGIVVGDIGNSWIGYEQFESKLSFRNKNGEIVLIANAAPFNEIGENSFYSFIANGVNNLSVFKNGVLFSSIAVDTTVTFSRLLDNLLLTNRQLNGELSHLQTHNRALSASEIQAQHDFLRLQIPEIEGIAIGNQYWPTSNYEGVVASDGVAIPQVTDNAAWAALTALAWDYHTSSADNGAIYGKIYNGYAADKLALKPPTGYRVMSRADWLQLSSVIGANSNKLKVAGTDHWAAANGTNETGFSAIGGGYRNADGTFSTLKTDVWYWTSDKYLVKIASGSGTITVTDGSSTLGIGAYIRLIRNQPVGSNERTITSTTIVSDIASTPNSTQIPFGYSVASIRLKTTANLTNIKVELWNNFYSGTPALVATLITGKTANNTTMVFPVLADVPSLLQDGTLRITATGANTFETIVEYNLQKNTF